MKRIIVNFKGEVSGDIPLFLDVDYITLEYDESEPHIYYALITMDKIVFEYREYINILEECFGIKIKETGKTDFTGGYILIEDVYQLIVDITKNNGAVETKDDFVKKIFSTKEERDKYIDENYIAKDPVGEMFVYDLKTDRNGIADYSTLKARFAKY